MRWTQPRYTQVKMDAEIGSYQEDTDPARETPFADTASQKRAQAESVVGSERTTFRLTARSLARRSALSLATPAGMAMALGAATGACSSSSGPSPTVNVVQTLHASGNGNGKSNGNGGGKSASGDDDIVTIGGGRARLGWNAKEPHLTPKAVGKKGLTLQWESPVLDSFTVVGADGGTTTYPPTAWASPLLVDHVTMPGFGNALSLVITATGNGWIYAISAAPADPSLPPPGTIMWKTQLTTPAVVVGTGTAVNPLFTIGVLSTPIIDLQSSPPRIYVTSADATAGWEVFAVSLTDGSIIPGWPVAINDAALEPVNQNGPGSFTFNTKGRAVQRSALNLSLDRTVLYVPFGGLRDLAAGWMVAIDTTSASIASSFSGAAQSVQTANAGMWAVSGVTVDDDGTMFVTTGNSINHTGPVPHVWGETLLSFAPSSTLTLTGGTYTPFNYCDMEGQDADLGGSSPVLIPPLDPSTTSTPRLAVFSSKNGNVFLVDRSNLHGSLVSRPACSEDSTTDQSLLPPTPEPQFGAVGPLNVFGPYQAAPVKVISRMHTTAAYFSDSDSSFVYVTGNTKAPNDAGTLLDAPPDVIRLKIVTTPGAPAYLAVDAEDSIALLNPSTPVVSSNGKHDPMVWVMDAEGSAAEVATDGVNIAHPVLYAIDGTTMQVVWRTADDELGQGAKFISPVVSDGQVIMATNRVLVYGLPNGN